MREYHKINSIFKRDITKKNKPFIWGEYSTPELEYLADNIWIWAEKVDGTNIRIMFDGMDITFGGKTDDATIPIALTKKLQDLFLPQLDKFKFNFNKEGIETSVCLYGEGYGPKIQKGGGNYRKDVDFVLFDIKIGHWWLRRDDIEKVARQFGLDVVPIVGKGTLTEAIEYTRAGFKSQWGDFIAEGLVLKPEVDLKSRSGERIITKVKHKDFK